MTVEQDASDASKPDRPCIFLSYTRADIEKAREIIGILEDAGFDVWWDGLLEGGVNYLPTTEAALEGADCVVVVWSKQSVGSNWVRDEAQSGQQRGRLVPISFDGTMAPLSFRQIQLIDLSGWKGDPQAEEITRITTSIRRLIGADQAATPAVPKAPKPTAPSPASNAGVSRRALVLGAARVTALGAGLAA
ncbi:MAG: toll/interleukin-1 receptor domain-containing protein [Pseudomonadota bacterium]